QSSRCLEIYHLRDSVRHVSHAVVGPLLRNLVSSFQAQSLQPFCPNSDFLFSVSLFYGQRLLCSLFRSHNHALVSWILCTRRHSRLRPTVDTKKEVANGRCFNRRTPSRFRTFHTFRYSIRSGNAAEGCSPDPSGGSPEVHRSGASDDWDFAPRNLFLHRNACRPVTRRRKSGDSVTGCRTKR